MQKYKTEALGSKLTLEIYSNDVKVTVYPKDGSPDSSVFTKENNTTYVFTKGKDKAVLKLNLLVKYIRSGVISVYENNKLTGKITFERDGVF